MTVNLRSLIGKLNSATRNTTEAAAGLCLSRTHYNVEIEHYLLKLLDTSDGDFAAIAKHYGIDKTRLATDLTRALDRFKTGNGRTPTLSPDVVETMTQAWTLASIDFGANQIRTGFTVLALVTHEKLSRTLQEVSKEFQKISPEDLRKNLYQIVKESREESAPAAAPETGNGDKPRTAGKTPHLDQFTVDLIENAKNGKIDPVLGRDFEIRQVVDILTRRRQNNPILVGEAGVGKTAIVEGFALRINQGDVPPVLKNVSLRILDLALLQAGAGVKGEFENRLKNLINEVKSSPTPIILFIDEAHTMIGAGGAAGQNDAANLLKPALARGELRTIAATTWSEYKKYFEKDPALTRRFQVVKVEEPGEDQCMVMLRGTIPALEKHHNVRILDQGLESAVRLSHRYLPDRQLPDKAISVLDTACARLALGHNAIPSSIENATRVLDDLAVQTRILERESQLGADHSARLSQIAQNRTETEAQLGDLRGRWDRERGLVERIRELRTTLERPPAPPTESGETVSAHAGAGAKPALDTTTLKSELAAWNAELEAVQGESPMVRVAVDSQIVGEVISGWTGIPVGKMLKNEIATMLSLEDHLGARVIGQSHALEAVSRRIRTAKAALDDPSKPVGVFLLVGPSGVGKTETALVLSDLLYGGEHNLITVNMSEFQEAHTVSTLKGSPPGYVGYGEGGVLTEAVRRRPYSVVLLDEVEKAHPDVLELFFQVFDKGRMEDGEGRQIDFKNTIIILTSNAGTNTIMQACADPEAVPDWEELVADLKPELNKVFKPAFLGRLVIVPYFPIADEALRKIIELKLARIQKRLQETHQVALRYEAEVLDQVASRCTEVESGARNVDNILTNTLLPAISELMLGRIAEGAKLESITVGVNEEGSFVYS